MNQTIESVKAYGKAMPLMNELKLWQYFIVPITISIITFIGIGLAAYGLSDNLGAFIAKAWVWEWGSETFRTVSDILAALVIITFGLLLYKYIVMALSAPFMSPVSEKIEAHYTGIQHDYRKTSNTSQLIRAIKINVRNLLRELVITIPILILGFFPVIGIVAPLILFVVQAYFIGFGNMDYTLERQYNFKESVAFVKRNRGSAIGNGAVFLGVLVIPVIGFIIVLPLAVTAASIQTLNIINQENALLDENPVF